jgi:hypothetical protein
MPEETPQTGTLRKEYAERYFKALNLVSSLVRHDIMAGFETEEEFRAVEADLYVSETHVMEGMARHFVKDLVRSKFLNRPSDKERSEMIQQVCSLIDSELDKPHEARMYEAHMESGELIGMLISNHPNPRALIAELAVAVEPIHECGEECGHGDDDTAGETPQ